MGELNRKAMGRGPIRGVWWAALRFIPSQEAMVRRDMGGRPRRQLANIVAKGIPFALSAAWIARGSRGIDAAVTALSL
jgi:hypothetical protein